jgi:DNA phosphorothioation-dependent restriction protein DptG
MPKRQDHKATSRNIWRNIDFRTVKQRVNEITDQIEEVLYEPSQIEASNSIHPEDYAKLREFMKVNQLTEEQAIAKIVNAFFSNTAQELSNTPSPEDETLERIAALEQQMAELARKLLS